MKLRPCIDIHNGCVKQIVGSTINDEDNSAKENFVAEEGHGGAYFANLFREKNLDGGHIILLNRSDSEYYEKTKYEALEALKAWPGKLQVGGGINPENAKEFLDAGASHVIVTSYVFSNGRLHADKLKEMSKAVGKERLVLDLSCKKVDNVYRIATDRWQKLAKESINVTLLSKLARYADEFLVHAVDNEGKQEGIAKDLIMMLGSWGAIPVTYAGGISSMRDIKTVYDYGFGKVDFTVGSALDIYGGSLNFNEIVKYVYRMY